MDKVSAQFDLQRIEPADVGGQIDLTLAELQDKPDEVKPIPLSEVRPVIPRLTIVYNFLQNH